MDDIITQPAAPQPPVQQQSDSTAASHRKRKIMFITGGVLVVVIIAGLVLWHIHKEKSVLTPQQTLNQLDASSLPVTSTPQQRASALTSAHQSSKQYTVTSQQRINVLNALKK